MIYIKSRKHSVPHRTPRHGGTLAASVAAALVLGCPAAALADSGAGGAPAKAALARVATPGPDQARDLPKIEVEAVRAPDYRSESFSPKFTQPLIDTTQTLQIITSDLFAQQGAATLAEVLRNSPGVGTFYVGENGNTSTGDAVSMRGFNAAGSIFVDGVRDLGSISRDVFNIQQVEVTKGPDGTEFGRTAPTGAINMVTKQPLLTEHVSGTVATGSGSQQRATLDWNHRLGQTAAVRLNVMGQDSGVPGRDVVENNRWGVAPSLAFGLGTPTRVYLDYLHIRQNNIPDGGVLTIGLPGYSTPDPERPELGAAPMVDPSNYYGTDADHDRVQADMFTARVEHELGADTFLRNTFRWGRTRQDYLLTAFMGRDVDIDTPDINDPSSWTVARNIPTFKHQTNRILANQTSLVTSFATGRLEHDLSAGIELSQEKMTTAGRDTLEGSRWPDASIYHPDPHVAGLVYGPDGTWSDGVTDTVAAYVFDTLKFGTRWQVNGGLRLDRYRTDFDSVVQCGGRRGPDCGGLAEGSPVPGVAASASDTLVNWKLGVLFKPTANGSVYVNYAKSAQPPGGEALELSGRANSADNPAFDPAEANTLEAGAKWSLSADRLLLSAALYRTEVTNQIERDPVDEQYYQTGKKRVEGVEVSAVGKLTDNWSLSAGYTRMDAEVIDGAAVADDGSMDLAYTPTSAFTAWTTYHLPFGLTLGGGARYSGAMKRGRDGAIGTPEFTRAYWVFDAMASYHLNDHLGLQLNLYNLADNDYVAAINKSGYRYTPGQPRSAMLTLNVQF